MKKRLDMMLVEHTCAFPVKKQKHILCPDRFTWMDKKRIKPAPCFQECGNRSEGRHPSLCEPRRPEA